MLCAHIVAGSDGCTTGDALKLTLSHAVLWKITHGHPKNRCSCQSLTEHKRSVCYQIAIYKELTPALIDRDSRIPRAFA